MLSEHDYQAERLRFWCKVKELSSVIACSLLSSGKSLPCLTGRLTTLTSGEKKKNQLILESILRSRATRKFTFWVVVL